MHPKIHFRWRFSFNDKHAILTKKDRVERQWRRQDVSCPGRIIHQCPSPHEPHFQPIPIKLWRFSHNDSFLLRGTFTYCKLINLYINIYIYMYMLGFWYLPGRSLKCKKNNLLITRCNINYGTGNVHVLISKAKSEYYKGTYSREYGIITVWTSAWKWTGLSPLSVWTVC